MFRAGVISIVFLFPVFLFSQAPSIISNLNQNQPGKGVVKVNHSQNLEDLLEKHIQLNKKNNTIQGFRIRIFSDSGQQARDKANGMRGKFMEIYPEVTTYLVFNTPNFKVYIGDYRTKSEALKMYKQIQKSFPKAFIVSDKINPPKI
jgi:hypothetical protein